MTNLLSFKSLPNFPHPGLGLCIPPLYYVSLLNCVVLPHRIWTSNLSLDEMVLLTDKKSSMLPSFLLQQRSTPLFGFQGYYTYSPYTLFSLLLTVRPQPNLPVYLSIPHCVKSQALLLPRFTHRNYSAHLTHGSALCHFSALSKFF